MVLYNQVMVFFTYQIHVYQDSKFLDGGENSVHRKPQAFCKPSGRLSHTKICLGKILT